MIKVLITGANGLLGQKLALLLDSDPRCRLTATARRELSVELNDSRFEILDVTKKDDVERVIEAAAPDVVIHTAAMTQVDSCETNREACWLNNVTAVEFVASACDRLGVHLIHISTDFVFDGSRGPLDESAKPNPISYYGLSKFASEEVVKRNSHPWTILRTVLVYGLTRDMSRSNIVLWVKNSLEAGKSIDVVDDQWRTPTLAEDLALGCLLTIIKKAKGVFHISGEEMMTPYELALRTADFFKLKKELINRTDSTRFKQPAKRPPKTGFIIDKAKEELGFQPRSFSEGLAMIASQL